MHLKLGKESKGGRKLRIAACSEEFVLDLKGVLTEVPGAASSNTVVKPSDRIANKTWANMLMEAPGSLRQLMELGGKMGLADVPPPKRRPPPPPPDVS